MRKIVIRAFILVSALVFVLPSVSVSAATIQDYSYNWAGYIANTDGKTSPFYSVSATWTIPTVTGTDTAYSSMWVGIGGGARGSSKLIQAGTEQDSPGSYSAWYEIYPQFPVDLGAVEPGDTVSVTISDNDGKPQTWNITMTVSGDTTDISVDVDVKLHPNFGSLSTAEFIVERPLLVVGHQLAPLADFHYATFSNFAVNEMGLSGWDELEREFMSNDLSADGVVASTGYLASDSFTVYYGTPV